VPKRLVPKANPLLGPFVRLGPNLLSVNSNTALKTIYGFKANVRKSDFYTAFPANKNTFNVHSSVDKVAHARKRRVLSHAFSDNAMKSMEKFVLDKIRIFCRVLPQAPVDLLKVQHAGSNSKGWSPPQNMAQMSDYLAFDVMGELAFGKSFDMIESPRNRFASTLVGNAAHRHLIVCINLRCSSNISNITQVRNTSDHPQLAPRQDLLPQNRGKQSAVHGIQPSTGDGTHQTWPRR
jgi:hypothetical protein